MKKQLITTLICSGLYLLNLPVTLGETFDTSSIKPVTMFKTKLTPCDVNLPTAEPCNKGCFFCESDLLQKALKYAFCTDDLSDAMGKMDSNCNCNFYYAQNNTSIKNGSYDIHKLFSLKELCDAKRVRITITLASDCYCEVNNKPELALGLYKNMNQCEIYKKFGSRAFMHHYLMKKYEIPMCQVSKQYNQGIQKFVAVIDLNQLEYENAPLYAVVTYMKGGFKYMKKNHEPKCKNYAYLVEVEKIS